MALVLPAGSVKDRYNFLFYNFVGSLMRDGLLDRAAGATLVLETVGRELGAKATPANTVVLAEGHAPCASANPRPRTITGRT